jgi:SAM-dependent methyltransferase
MMDWKAASRSFDAVAGQYDAHRPGYPDALVQSIIALTGIRPGDRILEIGSGTGKATEPFALRGFEMLCVEPGANLAAVAKRKFRGFPNVAFEVAAFEDWPVREGAFDLVMAAQSFHWVPKEVGYARAAAALREGGHLALFWNNYPDPGSAVFRDLAGVYEEHAPELAERRRDIKGMVPQTIDDIAGSGWFDAPEAREFPWSAMYSTDEYVGLLNTYSDHLSLPERNRQRLLTAAREVIERHGGQLERPYLAMLYVARKASLAPGASSE